MEVAAVLFSELYGSYFNVVAAVLAVCSVQVAAAAAAGGGLWEVIEAKQG